ncbi:MAG: DUF1549 and DUF1553 domain-containing protein [Gemmataceae bacterium]|nr:DUF1549 and DUF1553 domain-containing protein [Gemmataceae bacterium]
MTSQKQSRRPHLFTLVAGALVMAGLVLAQTETTAQTKKDAKEKAASFVDVMVVTAGGAEQVGFINEQIEAKWKENKITPSERCSDYEFIRRASLDIIGRIAKVDEINRFLKDPPERRRSKLIERLLGAYDEAEKSNYAEEFATNWANQWTNMLLTRTGTGKMYQEQMRDWLYTMFKEEPKADAKDPKESQPEKEKKPVQRYVPNWSKIVTDLVSAEGETNDNQAVNFILAHLGEQIRDDPTTNGKYDMVPVTSRTTRLFLGLRTQCVQCHDHPFNSEWGQHHFWGINAFYRQADPTGRPSMMAQKKKKGMAAQQITLRENRTLNVKGLVPYERRSGVLLFTDAMFLDGKKMAKNIPADSNRRKELAKFIVTSPWFAKSYVNRMWGHFFGRSFTKDGVDDFGEHNPISHPELLDKLADDWANKYQHNPKDLIRWICNSQAYGLSSVANKTNDKAEDEAFFARMLLKAMTPEQLFESLMTATDAKVGQAKESKHDLREKWLESLIVNFGDDEGNEGSFNGTVVQALLLMNGQDINEAIMDQQSGTVGYVLRRYAASPTAARDAMTHLYLAALNRPPRADEFAKILSPKMYSFRPGSPAQNPTVFWTAYYQDIFWAVLNSNEFILNH